MKKNSFKRFLAITLAAATALTFAPVSTLGLSGVIEAQAAVTTTKDVYAIYNETKGTFTLYDGDAVGASTVSSVTIKQGDKVTVHFSGFDDTNSHVAIDDTTVDATVVTGDNKGFDTADAATASGEKDVTLASTTSTTVGAHTLKIYGDYANATGVSGTPTDTPAITAKVIDFTVNVVAKPTANQNASIGVDDDLVTVKDSIGFANTLFTGKASDSESFYIDVVDSTGTATTSGLTFARKNATKDLPSAVDLTSTGVITIKGVDASNGVDFSSLLSNVKIVAPASAGTYKLRLYEGTAAADTLLATSDPITVQTGYTVTTKAGPHGAASAAPNNAGAEDNVVITTTPNTGYTVDTVSVTYTNNSNPASDVAISTTKTAANKYQFTVPSDIGAKITNTLPSINVYVTFKKGTDSSDTVSTSGTFTYGGVLNSIYAYKGATYDLAEHAAITYNGRNYSGSELNWYLIDASKTPNKGETRSDLKSIQLPASAGTVSDGAAGSLKITVSDPDEFQTDVASAVKTRVVAEAVVNGVRTVVYVGSTDFSVTKISDNVVKKVIEVTAGVQGTGFASKDTKIDTLDTKIANPTKDNIYLKASEVYYPVETPEFAQTDAHYSLTVKLGSGDDNPFKGSYLTLNNGDTLATGTYYETEYIPFKVGGSDTNTVYLLKVNSTISVNTSVNFRVKDEGSILATTYASESSKIAIDPAVYLNLVDAKTWNIKDHIETDVADISKVSFTYSSDSANVDVDSNGVLTAKSVGNAKITIKAKYNGIESKATLLVRVNQNGFDTVTVTGADGDVARVLNPRDYNNNAEIPSEYLLVTKQIPYVQIEITGNETTNKVETPVVVSKNNAKLSYSFVKDYTSKGLTIDPSTGKITIDYNKCTDGTSTKDATAMGVYAVKVVSNATNTSADTTSYYYVVVDYPDKTISGLQSNYTVGSCSANDDHSDAVEMSKESKGSAERFKTVNKNTDDFNGKTYYQADDVNSYQFGDDFTNSGIITRAYTAGKTMHVVAYNRVNDGSHTGYTAKLISLSSAAAVDNYVEKITDKDTGEVLYDHSVNATDTARELKINKATTIQVTLAHPVASVVSGSAVGLKIAGVDDNNHIYNETPYVTAVVNSKEVDVALYPNNKGTTVIQVGPSGHLTATDRTDIHHKFVNVAVTYTGENSATATKPAKVTGVKVSNKKGAKVTVSFKKVTTAPTIRYYVQKKIGKKTSGKSIGSTKTTLSVKKGATVKVRVKAYYYDENGSKHVGAYSAWKTLKTDKK